MAVSVVQKFGPRYSMAKWMLCSTGLIRYLYPTNDELKQLAGIPKPKPRRGSARRRMENQTMLETFHFDKSLNIPLRTTKVTFDDVLYLRFFPEFHWLLDFFLYGIFAYLTSEIYEFTYMDELNVNLSLIWCLIEILFATKVLLSLTYQSFEEDEESATRSVAFIMGIVYLLIAMTILLIDETTLELGLDNAYVDFHQTTNEFLCQYGFDSSKPTSRMLFKFCLAIWCGVLGGTFSSCGIRIAKMHSGLLRRYEDSKLKQFFLNVNYALPCFLVLLWVKPISSYYLCERIYSGFSAPIMTYEAFDLLRLIAVISTMLFKIYLMPWYLQAYLDQAYRKAERIRGEEGRITNVDYQRKIAAVFYYLCVAALQYVAPLLICIFFAILYKTMGDFQWNSLWNNMNMHRNSLVIDYNEKFQQDTEDAEQSYLTVRNIKMVFNGLLYRGVFGFATWWCCFIYFTTTTTGLIYHSYYSVD